VIASPSFEVSAIRRSVPISNLPLRSFVTSSQLRSTTTHNSSATAASAASRKWEYLLFSTAGENNRVGVVTLNRPKQLNALCDGLIAELNALLKVLDADPQIGCIVLTGSTKAFAAGADIKEMSSQQYPAVYRNDMLATWHDLTLIRKPIIAAVNGVALGGGCELAMMCDIILAGAGARFGLPEVTLGVIPGCGGTQRMPRAVGKSKAMEMILTAQPISAEEAAAAGLVSKVVPAERLQEEAVQMADKIAALPRTAIVMAKEAINAAYRLPLDDGLRLERRLFHSTFATPDQKEGMNAFLQKRKPVWSN